MCGCDLIFLSVGASSLASQIRIDTFNAFSCCGSLSLVPHADRCGSGCRGRRSRLDLIPFYFAKLLLLTIISRRSVIVLTALTPSVALSQRLFMHHRGHPLVTLVHPEHRSDLTCARLTSALTAPQLRRRSCSPGSSSDPASSLARVSATAGHQ